MSKVLFSALLIFSLSKLCGQTFNERFEYGHNTIACSVFPLDTGYIVSGFYRDTIPEYYLSTFISGFNLSGEAQWTRKYEDSLRYYIPRYDVNAVVSDSVFVIGCEGYSDGIANTRLIWFNQYGDTIMTRTYVSPYYTEGVELTDWNKIESLTRDYQGNLYFSAVIYTPSQADILITKVNSEGVKQWEEIFHWGEDNNLCFALQATDDGVIGGGGYIDMEEESVPIRIFELDPEGNYIWDVQGDVFGFISGFPKEILLDGDRIVVATLLGDVDLVGIKPLIYAIEDDTVLWHHVMDTEFVQFDQEFTNVILATDGNYVAGGLQYETLTEPDDTNGTNNWNGWLAKFSTEGELMWDRTYHYVESTVDEHKLYDLKLCPDGGFIFCGEAIDLDLDNPENEFPYQQAWLVKVDGCGCLVPGCDPDCTSGVEETVIDYDTTHFLAGPNPANQFLNIHILDKGFSQDREVRIFDLQGKVVKGFSANQGGATYVVDVEGLSSGTYLVSLFVGGGLVQSERVLKL